MRGCSSPGPCFQEGEAAELCGVRVEMCPLDLVYEQEVWVPCSGPDGAHLTVQLSVLRLCVFHDSIWWGQNTGLISCQPGSGPERVSDVARVTVSDSCCLTMKPRTILNQTRFSCPTHIF